MQNRLTKSDEKVCFPAAEDWQGNIRYVIKLFCHPQALLSRSLLLTLTFWIGLTTLPANSQIRFPTYRGYINDEAHLLTAEEMQQAERIATSLEQKTGAELAVAIVPTTSPLDPKSFAVKLFAQWKIGKKGKDNGILFLVAVKERRTEIEVGYGLEGVITDGTTGQILDQAVIPAFKQGNFGPGVLAGTQAIAQKISSRTEGKNGGLPAPNPTVTSSSSTPSTTPPQNALSAEKGLVSLLFFSLLLLLFLIGMARGTPGVIPGTLFGFLFAGVIGAVITLAIVLLMGGRGLRRYGGPGGSSSWGFPPSFGGGFGSGRGGFGSFGGFGGFGGGGSGGGGAGRSW